MVYSKIEASASRSRNTNANGICLPWRISARKAGHTHRYRITVRMTRTPAGTVVDSA